MVCCVCFFFSTSHYSQSDPKIYKAFVISLASCDRKNQQNLAKRLLIFFPPHSQKTLAAYTHMKYCKFLLNFEDNKTTARG